ncbi:MAG: radical SAM protein [Deferribacteres bacterium]|nr:radical SAM protein [Deferribacteres bacterium]
MRYVEPVFRPPSEAYSLILQITIGCSYNKCTFCGMYKTKKFREKSLEEIEEDLKEAKLILPRVRRIFLADGDPLVVDTEKMIEILKMIKRYYPDAERISAYATPQNLLEKSEEELKAIREQGLSLLYVGVESGSDEVLRRVKKGVNQKEMVQALNKGKKSGFKLSTTFILGLGGRELSHEHALESAKVVNLTQPDYTAALTLMLIPGTLLHYQAQKGEFSIPTERDIMKEMLAFVENINVKTTFRSNHVSNLIPIKGELPKDRERLSNLLTRYILMTPEKPLPSTWTGPF